MVTNYLELIVNTKLHGLNCQQPGCPSVVRGLSGQQISLEWYLRVETQSVRQLLTVRRTRGYPDWTVLTWLNITYILNMF